MKRSSAILLWVCLLWSFLGILFGIFSAILIYQLLYPSYAAVPSGIRWHRGIGAIEVMRGDFASGAVIHIGANLVSALVPILAWSVVWLTDRAALKTDQGRIATWSGAAYLLLVLVALLAMEFLVPRG